MIAAVETGGTKVVCAVAAVDAPGVPLQVRRFPTTTPDETTARINAYLDEAAQAGPLDALGVASFGPVNVEADRDRYGWVTGTPKPGWADTDLLGRIPLAARVPRVVLSDVKVLAIGTRLGQSGTTGAPKEPDNPRSQVFTSNSIATLELTPDQADTLINATATGKISLVLRSVADFGKKATSADTSNDSNATVKIIRFGRTADVTAGSTDQGQATVAPAAYMPLPEAVTSQPVVSVQPSGGSTTTVTTSTPPGPAPVTPN